MFRPQIYVQTYLLNTINRRLSGKFSITVFQIHGDVKEGYNLKQLRWRRHWLLEGCLFRSRINVQTCSSNNNNNQRRYFRKIFQSPYMEYTEWLSFVVKPIFPILKQRGDSIERQHVLFHTFVSNIVHFVIVYISKHVSVIKKVQQKYIKDCQMSPWGKPQKFLIFMNVIIDKASQILRVT